MLDIEGTVAPISFVTETLFPYARARVAKHLSATYDTEETQADLDLLRQQVQRSVICHFWDLMGGQGSCAHCNGWLAVPAQCCDFCLLPLSWHSPCLT